MSDTADPVTSPTCRVAYLCSHYPAVSHTFIRREIEAIRRHGGEVVPVSVRRVPPEDLVAPSDLAAHAETHPLLPTSARRLVGATVRTLRRDPGAVARALVDVVRTGRGDPRRTLWQCFYLAEALLLSEHLRDLGVRHVHVHHANVAADVAHHTVRLNRGDERPWTWSLTVHGPTEFADVAGFGLARKVASADAVVCIGDFCRSQVLAHGRPADAAKLRIIRCGVEPERFTVADRRGRTGRPLRVLCVGRLVPEKGQRVLLEALARLADDGVDVEVDVAGDGPDRAGLEAAAATLGVTERVRFLGAVDHDRIVELYAEADVFCLPSFAEGIPVVLMEAMATGLPVVTTRINGIPELVTDGRDGRMVAPARADLVADAIATLAADEEHRTTLGKQAAETVRAGWDIAAAGPRLVELFDTLPGAR